MSFLFFERLLDLVYPPVCFHCGVKLKNHGRFFLCGSCKDKINFVSSPPCRDERAGAAGSFSFVSSACEYEGVIREGIKQYKFGGKLWLSETLGRIFEEGLGRCPELSAADVIIPVPLSRRRRKTRGFNQSEMLALRASRMLNKPLRNYNLARVGNSAPQSGLSAAMRAGNVKGLFSVRRPEEIRGKEVLLVDDVFTTGATANECAGALISSGAKKVNVYTLARRF